MPDYFERHDQKTMNGREWEALKAYQKQQRVDFYAGGRDAYRAVRNEALREVRKEFRAQWSTYYAAKRQGGDPTGLAATKKALLDAQREALDKRREEASEVLREQRDRQAEAMLRQQQFDRAELGRRQEQGLRTYAIFDVIYPAPASIDREEPTKDDGKARWKPTPDRAALDQAEFQRAASVAEPNLASSRTPPAVVEKRPTTDRAEPREKPAPDRTATRVEQERLETAREMTDQAVAKNEDGYMRAIRASWNRSRSRGDRD
ncbi:hypothetical protein A5906_26225 [Bradyrhizobium sacchari]|uniref:hypothetical protein n=1 Tax=Bradyrhizobium sacchari TaxID=1399419 RepID=UPI0009AF272B|nr:hypothetical protein [Bradyrhizobium sacchari]OPY99229.1 hypothetical protein A5906_26225 [Bradyrhizobium sacchari]